MLRMSKSIRNLLVLTTLQSAEGMNQHNLLFNKFITTKCQLVIHPFTLKMAPVISIHSSNQMLRLLMKLMPLCMINSNTNNLPSFNLLTQSLFHLMAVTRSLKMILPCHFRKIPRSRQEERKGTSVLNRGLKEITALVILKSKKRLSAPGLEMKTLTL